MLTIINELATLREETARRLDRPPFKVLTDETLLAVAQAAPRTEADLAGAGLSDKQIRLWGEAILAAVKRGTVAPLVRRRPSPRPSEAMLVRLEKLKTWRKLAARGLQVESDIVLPKPLLHVLAERAPRTSGELQTILSQTPWRFEQFGAQILSVLEG
jgi:ribonuclease D